MNELLRTATLELARFLGAQLPKLSDDWWSKHVDERLSFQQQRLVAERGITTLQQLDLAALLRVLDQNWYELSNLLRLPREGRGWVKEMQTVRNKWAHLSGESMPPSESYRDADTLGRLLRMIEAAPASLAVVEAAMAAAVSAMKPRPVVQAPEPEPVAVSQGPATMFKVGDLVALRSSPHRTDAGARGGRRCRRDALQRVPERQEGYLLRESAAASDRGTGPATDDPGPATACAAHGADAVGAVHGELVLAALWAGQVRALPVPTRAEADPCRPAAPR